MNISYNIEKLKKIIDDLCTLTGLSMAVVDTKHNYIYTNNEAGAKYCRLIQSAPEGKARCHSCDGDMLRRSAENRLPYSHTCHGGLCDTSVPILKDGAIAGYIIIGRVRKGEAPSDEVVARLSEYGIKKEEVLSAFPTATALTDSQHASLIRLISHIIFENAIEIDYGEFINRATEYIAENLQGSLTINDLCRDLFVSKNMLYESFESYFGKTPNEYITDKRIEAAKALLKSKRVSVTATAESVGIYNYTYFSKLFKKKTGMTPREYIKMP